MKHKLFTLLLAVAASIGTMFAEKVKIGDLYYNLDATNQTAEVTSSSDKYSGAIVIPSSVTYNSKTFSVTSIGYEAFAYCTSLTSVTIPNSVTSIGCEAFAGCSGLTSIEIPNSVTSIVVYAFSGCTGLTSVTIGNSVTFIGNYAFRGTGLTSVTIPNSVTSIGDGAFSSCSGLTSISVEEGNAVYDSRDNCNAIIETASNTLVAGCPNTTIPNSVTSIGNAFFGCSGLTSVTIPNSVTSIGNYAFSDCSGLTSLTCEATTPPTLGSYVFSTVNTSIPLYVPGGSIKLYKAADQWKDFTNILPIGETPAPCITASGTCGAQGDNLTWELTCDGMLTISGTGTMADYDSGNSAPWYSSRKSITSVVINNTVTSIGEWAFNNCSGLTSVTIPNSVTSIERGAFMSCTGLTSVTIGNSATSIGDVAFYYCTGLTSVTIPNSVISIGGWAFSYCSGLTSVTIPNSVTSIGDRAFCGCTGLTSPVYNAHVFAFMPTSYLGAYTIPDGIESIAGGAFFDCTGLTSVTIPNSVTSIGDRAFYECSSLTALDVATDNPYYCSEDGVLFNKDKTTLIQYLEGKQGAYAIPNSVTSIRNEAFWNCTGLTSVTIPNSVTSIGERAFYYCIGLTSVTIPNSVTSIGDSAFYYCSSLTSITCEAITPPTLGSDVFFSVDTSIPLYVPFTSVGAYKTANGWKDFSNIQSICPIASGTCGAQGDNLTWEFSCDRVLTISGTGEMADYSFSTTPWYAYSDSIMQIKVSNGVTHIGKCAFQSCTMADSIILGTDILSIEEYALYHGGPSNLTTIICNTATPPALKNSKSLSYGCSIIVPCSSLSAYKENWTSYKNNIRCEGESYIIRFVNYDGTELQSGEVEYGETPVYEGEIPTKPTDVQYTYTFSGWTPEVVAVTGEATYTAAYESTLNKYQITWLDEEGNPILEEQVESGATPIFSGDIPTKASDAEYSYEFVGWLPKIKPVTGDARYITYFDRHKLVSDKVYNVNINSENCSLHISNELPAGTKLQVEAVADECFQFEKWSDNNTDNPRTITVTEDSNLTAEFNKVTYTIIGENENEGGEVQIIP